MLRILSFPIRKPVLALCIWIFYLSSCTFPPPPSCEADYLIHKIDKANATPATTDTIELPTAYIYTLKEVDNKTAA